MKLTAIILLAAFVQLTAQGQAQPVTLSLKKAPLEIVFQEIQKQTGYNFFFEEKWVKFANNVTIDVKNVSLIEALDSCFAHQPFTYAIAGTTITIVARKSAAGDLNFSSFELMGRVTDPDGNPLQGASIRINHSILGTSSDKDGYWKLLILHNNSLIEASYIGYRTELIKVPNKRKSLTIALEIEPQSLQAVLLKGYSTPTRRDHLGAVTTITAETINSLPINSILDALPGRVAGLTASRMSGNPGSGYNIQMRGQKSIGVTAGKLPPNSPLFVIDGVPFPSSSETLVQDSKIFAFSPFSTFNADDIESVEVLKDANSTSIYGSLGANGVVLIHTKKPRPGTSVDVKMYTGWERITHRMKYMNTEQYLEMRREAFNNDNHTPMTFMNAPEFLAWDTTRDIDWGKLIIGNTAHLSNANIRLAGGSDRTQFTVSIGYNKESTVLPGDLGKTLASVNLNVKHTSVNKKLDLQLMSSYGLDKSHLLSHDITDLIDLPPNAPSPFDSLGRLQFRENGYPTLNPVSFTMQPFDFDMERITGSIRLSYQLFPCLFAKTSAGYTTIRGDQTSLIPIASQDPDQNPTGSAVFGNSKSKNWIVEPQLEFSKGFHDSILIIKALAGSSFREQTATTSLITGDGYITDANLHSIEGAQTRTATNDFKQYRIKSTYGLINLKWNKRYSIEGTARRDGSSRFGPDRQFASFYSVAGGWIFSDAKFVRNHIPFINFGKLRFSYGTTGNDQIGDYQFLDSWIFTQYQYQGPSFKPSRLYNNDYRWEEQRSIDIGLDMRLLNDRISFTGTWSQNRTGNQLIGYTLPTQTGFSSVLKNFPGLVQNRTIELEISSINVRDKNLEWRTAFNFTLPKNKLLKFPGLASSSYGDHTFLIGQPLNLAWGYRTSGVDPATGIYQILHADGTPIDLTSEFPSREDLVKLGNYDPVFYGGLENTFRHHNWQASFLFQFVKQMGRLPVYSKSTPAGIITTNQPAYIYNGRWQEKGNAIYQQFTQDFSSTAYLAGYFYADTEASFTDASFVRLKSLSLSYTLPADWSRKLKCTSIRFFTEAQNLLTFTPYKGNDPENGLTNPLGLPLLKTVVIGLQASL